MSGYRLILVSKVLLRLIGRRWEQGKPVTRDARIRVRVSVKIDGGLGYLGDEVGAAPTSERAAGGPVLLVWDALNKPDEYARRNTQDATTWSHMST